MPKLIRKVLPKIVVCLLCFFGAFVPATANVEAASLRTIDKVWRLYNSNTGEHFYTTSKSERDHLYTVGWDKEGYGWTSPNSEGEPVYRLYNPNAGDHHYTMSVTERDNLVSVGWQYEGVSFLAYRKSDDDNVPVYREYNPNAATGAHNFTTSKSEHDYLVSIGWKDEGIAFYVAGVGYQEDAEKFHAQTYSNGIPNTYYVGDIKVGNFSAHCYEDRDDSQWLGQRIVDASNSAYVDYSGDNALTAIGDHASQGFQAFMYANTLTYAGKTYTKVSQYSARMENGSIILSNGNSMYVQRDGTLCTYTCTNNSGSRVVAYWR